MEKKIASKKKDTKMFKWSGKILLIPGNQRRTLNIKSCMIPVAKIVFGTDAVKIPYLRNRSTIY